MIREGDIGEKLFPDFPDMKVDFSEIGIGKIGKIGLPPPPPQNLPPTQIEMEAADENCIPGSLAAHEILVNSGVRCEIAANKGVNTQLAFI